MKTQKETIESLEPVANDTRINAAEPDYPAPGYAWYMVGVLTIIYIFSFIDRQILSLLVEPITKDLQISKTQLSLLMGFAFVFFYTLFGIPLGRLADIKSRRTIIAIGCAFWSVMTALCGIAQNYMQMFLYRLGVGVGEASLSPAAFSLISDSFRKERLATAISVYSMGIYLGAGMAYLLGGVVVGLVSSQEMYQLPLVGATRPWQVIFFIVGLPGILLALLMYTIQEPVRRGLLAQPQVAETNNVSIAKFIKYISENRLTFICHSLGFGLIALSTNAGGQWYPTYLRVSHGWSTAKVGIVLGIILSLAGTAGIVAGGRLSDWLAERGYQDAPMRVGLFAVLLMIPTGVAFSLAPNGNWATWLYIPTAFFASAPFGVAPAAIQQIVPNEMRGQASAIYIFFVNVIGLGIGPTAVAVLNDYVFQNDQSIRYSLIIVGGIAQSLAALSLWLGMKPFAKSLIRLKSGYPVNP
ncbi:MAG: MFS transporter [Acidobacteriota bacterium]